MTEHEFWMKLGEFIAVSAEIISFLMITKELWKFATFNRETFLGGLSDLSVKHGIKATEKKEEASIKSKKTTILVFYFMYSLIASVLLGNLIKFFLWPESGRYILILISVVYGLLLSPLLLKSFLSELVATLEWIWNELFHRIYSTVLGTYSREDFNQLVFFIGAGIFIASKLFSLVLTVIK